MDILKIKNQDSRYRIQDTSKPLGFTLIELLLTMTIISFLIVIAIWTYRKQLDKGFDSKRKSDIYFIKSALEEYEKDNDCYPATLPTCGSDGEDNFLHSYLAIVPCDPQTKQGYVYNPESSTGCSKWYWIFSKFSNKTDPVISQLGCSLGCGPTLATASFDYYQTSPNAPEPAKK